MESPELFRKWAAIGAVAASLEQKVWVQTSSPLFPNIYMFLIGHPGVGKTRTIMAARAFLSELTELHIAPTSMLMASLVDCLLEAKRTVINLPNPPLEFNSMVLTVDEWGAFMHQYDDELVAGLTTFYDVNVPYSQHRRGKDIRIKIKAPQLSILAGSTPVNLLKFMPELAWEQGFTSRILFIFSDERPQAEDMFAVKSRKPPPEMIHDLKIINALHGEFTTSKEYENAVNAWRKLGQVPVPNHPRLTHYNSRRVAHLIKLSMVACADRSNDLLLAAQDFNRAMGWLLEAEAFMPDIFKSGIGGMDAKAMDEILHYIKIQTVLKKDGVSEHKVVNFARERVPAHSVMRVLDIMIRSGMISIAEHDIKTGLRHFKPVHPDLTH